MSQLNDAMDGGDPDAIRQALCDPRLQLENFDEKNLTHYVTLLQKKREEKAKVLCLRVWRHNYGWAQRIEYLNTRFDCNDSETIIVGIGSKCSSVGFQSQCSSYRTVFCILLAFYCCV